MRALLRRAHADGVGKRYLIQHSAGSGKSNTIAWLAHQLVELRRKGDPDGSTPPAQFDSIIVITDRRALDTQARMDLVWVETPAQLPDAVRALRLPDGIGHAWAAGEAGAIAEVRRVLVGQHGLPKERVRASAYWKRGQADHHEAFEG